MYKSPIDKIYGEIQTYMAREDEKMVMKAVRDVGISVDKESLIKVLQYDRNQYTKGYEDGKNEVLDKIRAEIKALSPEPTAYDVVDGNPIKDAVWETIADVLKIIDKYKSESEKNNEIRD